MKAKLRLVLFILLPLVVLYALGPRPAAAKFTHDWPHLSDSLSYLVDSVSRREARMPLRPHNEASFHFYDSVQRRPYVILYLHGFSASHAEGAPVHQQIAREFGANLYLARLAGHGRQDSNLVAFNTASGWRSAKEALAVAEKMGEKVIVMGTSTGCTFALLLAAHFPDKVHAIINLSPNIRVNSHAAFLLNNPWGAQIAQLVFGSERKIKPSHPDYGKYWDTLYTVKAVVELQELLESGMQPHTFNGVQQPVLNLCYYKNEAEQDQVVRVDKMRWMHRQLGTPQNEKQMIELPSPGNHVLASPIKSQDPESVRAEISRFCRSVLQMPAAG